MSLMIRPRLWPTLMDEFLGRDMSTERDFYSGINMPAVNVVEDNDQFRIEVAAPGLERKDFKLDVEDNILTIQSEKEMKNESNDSNYIRREFSYSSFRRSFTLPDTVHSDKIHASYKEGVLTIQIPKKDEVKKKPARAIEIS